MINNLFLQVREYIKSNPYCLNMLFPNARQKGNELYFDSPSYNSWSYNIVKSIVKDFRSGKSQDLITVYQIIHGIAKPIEAAGVMAMRLGISQGKPESTTINKNVSRQATPSVIPNKEKERNNKINRVINVIWQESLPIGGTVAERYLNKRGITLPFSSSRKGDALRLHPALWHNETNETHPTLVASVHDNKGRLSAIHRHYLEESGDKLNVKSPKKMLGSVKGNVVKLNNRGAGTLAVCEGIESGLSILQRTKYSVWCALTAGNLANFPLERAGVYTDILVFPDIEGSGAGIQSARDLVKRGCSHSPLLSFL